MLYVFFVVINGVRHFEVKEYAGEPMSYHLSVDLYKYAKKEHGMKNSEVYELIKNGEAGYYAK